jgi:hypothetical protein
MRLAEPADGAPVRFAEGSLNRADVTATARTFFHSVEPASSRVRKERVPEAHKTILPWPTPRFPRRHPIFSPSL